MIYLIGGAPRVGKSILCQQVAEKFNIGWISTDLLMDMLRMKNVHGVKSEWNAAPEAIAVNADWFFSCLERFVWGVQSMADGYVIEGVDFLPAQASQLAARFHARCVFLGCSEMTFERFDSYPGRSLGYAALPEETRRQFSQDIVFWSAYIRQEAERYNCPYIDMSDDFQSRLEEAEALLIGK